MVAENNIKLGQKTALLSFVFGTIIFGLYFFTLYDSLLFVGYIYILIAGLVNIVVLIFILKIAKRDKENRSKLLKTSGLLFLNIPIMICYCLLAIVLLNTMRITFVNSTDHSITKLSVFGCGNENIDRLEKLESKTVWIDIKGDCAIYVKYFSNGLGKIEVVEEYVTSNAGAKKTFLILDKIK
jgi:phosphoglycerol transferase MdoB-like AlkP superfamily enzyme